MVTDDPMVDDDVLTGGEEAKPANSGESKVGLVIKSRRQFQLAAASMWATVLFTLGMMFFVDAERLSLLEPVIVWFYGTMAAVITGYFGFNAWAFIKNPRATTPG